MLHDKNNSFGKVKYAPTKIMGNTKNQMTMTEASGRTLKKEISWAVHTNDCGKKPYILDGGQ